MLLRFFITIIFLILFSINIYSGKLFLYLNIKHNNGYKINFYLKKISFISNTNKIFSFSINKKITSFKIFNQIFLKKINLPNGQYNRVILTFKSNKKIELFYPIKVKNNSKAIFFIWNVKASLKGNNFKPLITIETQKIPLRGELVFVTSKEEDLLFFIRVDKNQVCAVMDIVGSPVEMALSCINDKIFVLTEKNHNINVIEVSSFKKSDIFVLPFVIKPQILTKFFNNLIVGDMVNNRIMMVNNENGELQGNIEIGEGLSDIKIWENKKYIIAASSNEQLLYFLNENLKILKTVKLACNPNILFVYNDFLYITEPDCNFVLKYNLNSGIIQKKYRIFSPNRVLVLDSKIYITSLSGKYLYIVNPKYYSYSKKIKLSMLVDRISYCIRRGWIYLSAKNKDKIEVIDLNSEKSYGTIELGAKPYDIKVGRTLFCK